MYHLALDFAYLSNLYLLYASACSHVYIYIHVNEIVLEEPEDLANPGQASTDGSRLHLPLHAFPALKGVRTLAILRMSCLDAFVWVLLIL